MTSRDPDVGHRAAGHLSAAMPTPSKWRTPLMIVGVIALGGLAYWMIGVKRGPTDNQVARMLTSPDAKPIRAGSGQTGNVSLGDGTAVKLGSGSVIRVPVGFGTDVRAVSLMGSASFAPPAADKPFELHANGVIISLPSGRVDVRSDSAGVTVVRVGEGQARVKVGDSSWTAPVNQAFAVKDGKVSPADSAMVDESFAWMDGRFVATGSVSDIVAKMKVWYGADLKIGDGVIADRPASVTGRMDSVMTSIKSLEKSAKVQMRWNDKTMMLFQAGK